MRLTLALLGLVLATAVQARMLDVILHGWRLGKELVGMPSKAAHFAPHDAAAAALTATAEWLHAGFDTVEDQLFQKLVHPAFPAYQLRVAMDEPTAPFCDPNVRRISGYLDIRDDAHLWFSLFESRRSPSSDPLLLWLNGGPGCSSSLGMLMEMGPCWIDANGTSTRRNEYAWNAEANLLFLDQPLQVGYSYSENGAVVDTSAASAEDVYAFLQLFLARFPQYAQLPFSVAAESYGGHYAPHIGAEIHRRNQAVGNVTAAAPLLHVALDSVMIGNGLTFPKVQFPSVVEYSCSPKNKYRLWEPDSETCRSLEKKSELCSVLIEQCDRFDSRLACVPAALFCWASLYGPMQELGVNPYDVRRKCDRGADGPLCYREIGWIEHYMNRDDVKAQLGVPRSLTYQSCNMEVNQRFLLQGDSMVNSAALLAPLLADGVRVLAYAGEADFMCNAIGIHEWVLAFDNVYHNEINNATETPMFVHGSAKPQRVGYTISAGEGHLAFAWVDNAGHMVPLDQPAVAQQIVNRWLAHESLA